MKKIAPAIALMALVSCTKDEPAPAVDAGAPDSASSLPQTCMRSAPAAPVTTCNGDASLCGKTYDKVAVPMTHNAMSSSDDGFGIPNQHHGLATQLADGVRGMMLDLHYYDPESNLTDNGRLDGPSATDQVYLCHGACAFGKTRLLDGLCTIASFLDANPGEILSIIFETYVSDADLDAVLRASGLDSLAYAHTSGPWPTLRELVDTDKRLVVFLEKGGGAPPYLMPAYTGNIWDTPYDFKTQGDFNCSLGRGVAGSPLFLINHWLSNPLSDPKYAAEVNVTAVLQKRVTDCTTSAGRGPTFVSVDFYDIGDLFSVVRTVNGL